MRKQLEARKAELEAKLNMFLSSEAGLRHQDLISKFKAELADIEEQLELMETVKDAKPVTEKPKDMVLDKLVNEYAEVMDKIELLKGAGKDYGNFFKKLEALEERLDGRLLLLEKVDGLDTSEMIPAKVANYRKKVGAIKKQLEADAIEKMRAEVELDDAKKATLAKMGLDIGLNIDLDSFNSGEAE